MRLSIITINRNNAVGLRKTMRSVLNQSHVDFEYIIIDGNSVDCSVKVINDFIDRPQFVCAENGEAHMGNCLLRWLSEPDSGIYNAMNKGIRMANGEYLLFLNSGDYLVSPSVLEEVFHNECTADLLCARCRVSENGIVVWTSELVPDVITLGTLYWKGLMHQSTFIRRDLLLSMGLYDESFRWLADIQFWYKTLILGDATSQPIDVITSDYNHEGVSSSIQKDPRFIDERMWPWHQPVLKHIMPDFIQWKEDKQFVSQYGWIKKDKFVQFLLRVFCKMHKFFN